MSIKELIELLMVKNVPQDLYSLEGGLPSESYCIEKTEDKWHLYICKLFFILLWC
jgi:hypothetical protein